MGFVASKTFLSIKSTLKLHGTFWLYGCLGAVGFFVIYWTFSETEGRSLEDIEEFYKTGLRGKIPKRPSTERTSQALPIHFTPSMNYVRARNENKETAGKDTTIIKHNTNSIDDISGGNCGRSTETLQTTFTASVASLQNSESTAGDVRETKIDSSVRHLPGKEVVETEIVHEKYGKVERVEKEKSNKTVDVEGKPSELKAAGDQDKQTKVTIENNGNQECDTHVKEKGVSNSEGDVEERTNM